MTRNLCPGPHRLWWLARNLGVAALMAYAASPAATARDDEKARAGDEKVAATQPAPTERACGSKPAWGPGRRGRERHGPWPVEELVERLFRPSPTDEGALQTGEEDELLKFAQQHTPRLYRVMSMLRQRDPERFRTRLNEAAPRLRHLRRVYAESPELGDLMRTYADNLFELQRGLRALRRASPSSASYSVDLQRLRDLVTANVDLEAEALETLAAEAERRQAERVSARLEYLLRPETDLAAELPVLRELVTAVQNAATEEERFKAREQLQRALERQATLEVQALRERAQRKRENAAAEVDRRMQRLTEELGRPTTPANSQPDQRQP